MSTFPRRQTGKHACPAADGSQGAALRAANLSPNAALAALSIAEGGRRNGANPHSTPAVEASRPSTQTEADDVSTAAKFSNLNLLGGCTT